MFIRRIPLCAPEGAEGGSSAAAASTAAASETTAAATTTQAGPPVGGTDLAKLIADAVSAAMAPVRTELVDFRREARNKLLAGTPGGSGAGSTAVAAPAAQVSWGPSEQLAFRDTIEEAGISVNVEQRRILETLVKAEGGSVADPIAWVRTKAEAFGWRKVASAAAAATATVPAVAAATQTAAPAQQRAAVDTGAPMGTSATSSLPDDPSLLSQSAIDSMTPEQAQAHYQRWQAKTGRFVHPFAAARERAKSGGDLSAAAAVIAQALTKK